MNILNKLVVINTISAVELVSQMREVSKNEARRLLNGKACRLHIGDDVRILTVDDEFPPELVNGVTLNVGKLFWCKIVCAIKNVVLSVDCFESDHDLTPEEHIELIKKMTSEVSDVN